MNVLLLIIVVLIFLILVKLHSLGRFMERIVRRIELTDQEKHLEDMSIDDPETYEGVMEAGYASRARNKQE